MSFFEPMSKRKSEQASLIVPYRVISSLSKLEELNFDVSPDDIRWSAAAVEAIISDISKLRALSTLKFYFPKVELLSYFKWEYGIALEFPLYFLLHRTRKLNLYFHFHLHHSHVLEFRNGFGAEEGLDFSESPTA